MLLSRIVIILPPLHTLLPIYPPSLLLIPSSRPHLKTQALMLAVQALASPLLFSPVTQAALVAHSFPLCLHASIIFFFEIRKR